MVFKLLLSVLHPRKEFRESAMKPFNQLILVFLSLLFAGSSSAALITIEPDDYAHGTNISIIKSGIRLHAISQNLSPRSTVNGIYVGDIFVAQGKTCVAAHDCDRPYVAASGEKVFGWQSEEGYIRRSWSGVRDYYDMDDYPDWAPDAVFMGLMVSFLDPTDYVSILGMELTSPTLMAAYDSVGNRLATSQQVPLGGKLCCSFEEDFIQYHIDEISITRSSRDIAYVVIGGDFSSAYLDRLIYSVPEPLGIVLFGTGLMALGFKRRRMKATAS